MTIAVTLLTGFLGSGKTTLLNGLLAKRGSKGQCDKLAVIVNEFGDIGIDGELLPGEMTQQVELPGGCICCQLDEDLEKTIIGLVEKQKDISQILIETTGIAEPLPISWTLGRKPLNELVRLGAVVTVVDASEHERHLDMSPSVDNQVDYADILFISKIDLVTSLQLSELKEKLRNQNEYAPIIAESHERSVEALERTLNEPNMEESRHAQGKQEQPDFVTHHRDMETLSIPIDGPMDLEELTEALESLPPNYIRIKGMALMVDERSGSDEARWMVFHRVGARVSTEYFPQKTTAKIVAIGKNIEVSVLASCLSKAMC